MAEVQGFMLSLRENRMSNLEQHLDAQQNSF